MSNVIPAINTTLCLLSSLYCFISVQVLDVDTVQDETSMEEDEDGNIFDLMDAF